LHAFDHNPAMLPISSTSGSANLWPGVSAALVGCAAAASVVFWVLNFPAGSGLQDLPSVQSAHQVVTGPSSPHLARAWGVQAALPEVSIAQSSRFVLWGVVAGASRPFRVGQTVTDGVVLQSLGPKQAQLGASAQGAALFSLSLPGTDKAP
jgi:general secretion pathway protein C